MLRKFVLFWGQGAKRLDFHFIHTQIIVFLIYLIFKLTTCRKILILWLKWKNKEFGPAFKCILFGKRLTLS